MDTRRLTNAKAMDCADDYDGNVMIDSCSLHGCNEALCAPVTALSMCAGRRLTFDLDCRCKCFAYYSNFCYNASMVDMSILPKFYWYDILSKIYGKFDIEKTGC